MRRIAYRVFVVAVAMVIGSVLAVAPAHAADGDDPEWFGCTDSGVSTLRTPEMPDRHLRMVDPANGAEIGYAYLRYSSLCETQWVRVTYNSGYYPQPSIWRQNQSGTNQYTSWFAPWQGLVWTFVLDNMRYQAGCGGVHIYRGVSGGSGHVGWYYLGCA